MWGKSSNKKKIQLGKKHKDTGTKEILHSECSEEDIPKLYKPIIIIRKWFLLTTVSIALFLLEVSYLPLRRDSQGPIVLHEKRIPWHYLWGHILLLGSKAISNFTPSSCHWLPGVTHKFGWNEWVHMKMDDSREVDLQLWVGECLLLSACLVRPLLPHY